MHLGPVDEVILLRVCSMRIMEQGIGKDDIAYLVGRGVRYVGEICYLHFSLRDNASLRERRIKEALCLPMQYDPIQRGWLPPYWRKKRFHNALRVPPITYFSGYTPNQEYYTRALCWRSVHRNTSIPLWPFRRTYARDIHAQLGLHSMGDLIQAQQQHDAFGVSFNNTHQRHLIHSEYPYTLWAMAILPPGWKRVEQAPEVWLCEKARIETEVEETKLPRAWVVEHDFKQARIIAVRVHYADPNARYVVWDAYEHPPIISGKSDIPGYFNVNIGRMITHISAIGGVPRLPYCTAVLEEAEARALVGEYECKLIE